MKLRRVARLSVDRGVVSTYCHGAIASGLGRIGVLVALESSADESKLEELGKNLLCISLLLTLRLLTVNELDPLAVERERVILIDQAKASGRPQDVIEKMVEGRLKKFYEEVVLLEQTFVVDGKTKLLMR